MSYRDLLNSNRRIGRLLLSGALALGVASFGAVAASADAQAAAEPAAVAAQNSYADVLSRVAPAVVTVRASRRAREAQQFPFMGDATLRELFGERFRQQAPRGEERVGRGLDS